jgi:cysteine-rich repeat protein
MRNCAGRAGYAGVILYGLSALLSSSPIYHKHQLPFPCSPRSAPPCRGPYLCALPAFTALHQQIKYLLDCIAKILSSQSFVGCCWQMVTEGSLELVRAHGAASVVSLAGCWSATAPAAALRVAQTDACFDAPEEVLALDIAVLEPSSAEAGSEGGARTVFVIEGKGRTLMRFAGCGISSASLGPGGDCAPVSLCGEGARDGGREDCDDGNRLARDGCGPDCRVEPFCECYGGALNAPDTCACSPNRPFSVAALPAGGSAGAGWWWWQQVLAWPQSEVDAFKPSITELG